MSIRSIFASDKQEVNGQRPPPPPRVIPRAPMLPMAMPEQQRPAHLHPTTYALDQLDAALQENRRLTGNIEGLEIIIADLQDQLRNALSDRQMYRGYATEIMVHLGYVRDASATAHRKAMEAAEQAVAVPAEPEAESLPEPPQDLDEAPHSLEEQLREVTAEVQAATEAPTEPKT